MRQIKSHRRPILNALKGRIREKQTSYKKLSIPLGLDYSTLSQKINGKSALTGDEMNMLGELLDIEESEVIKFFIPNYRRKI